MESLLGFNEPPPTISDVVLDQSHSFKLVPWISWDEWDFVRVSLFSSSANSVASALQRIATWRSRGCLPVVIDVTASIVEIQQKDSFFRDDLAERAVDSEEMLAMLYCMSIMRLVNGVIEKTRKKAEVSIAEAAGAIGIPRLLIDIRHEGSHRDLPSLQLVRLASVKALDWLKSYYWEPQKNAIPNQGNVTHNLRKEIKHKLHELSLCLKVKQATRSDSSLIKGKRPKHLEHRCGPNKFLSFMTVKHSNPKISGSKKQVTKTLKNVLRLFSSFSVEVVSVLLELLLKSLESSDLLKSFENPQNSTGVDNMPSVLDEWKPVIIKLSNKGPELLWCLLKAVLEKIETQEARRHEIDEHWSSEHTAESLPASQLSCLFEWLVRILSSRKPGRLKASASVTEDSSTAENSRKEAILELLRKCLVAFSHGNNQLMTSSLLLAHMLGSKPLNHKLEKLLSLNILDQDVSEDPPFESNFENFLSHEKESIDQAVESFELIKLHQTRRKNVEPRDDNVKINTRWVVAKSWNPCPIGMLPHTIGSSGLLPVLDYNFEGPKITKLSFGKDQWELEPCSGKREASSALEPLGDLNVKKMRDSTEVCEFDDKENATSEDIEGHLMIDGVWKKVRQDELLAITADIKILV